MFKRDLSDLITGQIKKASDILFIENPTGTSIGVFFGATLNGFMQAFKDVLPTALSQLGYITTIPLGVFLFNIRKYLSKNNIDPRIQNALDQVRRWELDGTISSIDASLMYKKITNCVYDSITQKKDAGELAEQVMKARETE